METDGSHFYVGGGEGHAFIHKKIFANKISADGESEALYEYTLDTSNRELLFNISSVSNEQHFIVYGSFNDLNDFDQGEPITKGISIWLDKDDLSEDTVIVVQPLDHFSYFEDAMADKQGNIYTILEEIVIDTAGFKKRFNRIIKFNKEGNIIWDYTYPEKHYAKSLLRMAMVGDKIVFTRRRPPDNYAQLVCIDTTGQLLWKYNFEHTFTKVYEIARIKAARDGHLLIAGIQRSDYYGWSNVGFIAKLSQNGNLLWERIFEVDKGQDPIFGEKFTKSGKLFDIEELPNGDLVAAGLMQNVYDDPKNGLRHDDDLWIVRTDSTGCIAPGCGLVQSIQNGRVLVDSCKYLKDQAEWYYTHWNVSCRQTLSKVEIIGDTLIGNRLCSVLGVIENDELVSGSELIVFYEFESGNVYFYENGEFKLLYNFSLDVFPGDTIEYYLPQNFEYYDISSSDGTFPPSDSSYKLFVESTPYIELEDGTQLRTWETTAIPNATGDCFEMNTIFSGIGSEHGFLGKPCDFLPAGCYGDIRCFESDTLQYFAEDECLVSSTTAADEQNFELYPNPAEDVLRISTSETFDRIAIYDVSGRIVLRQEFSNQIDIKSLHAGAYILKLWDDEGRAYSTLFVKE